MPFKKYGVVLAYLFGSYATGLAGAKSDIDIAVLLPKDMIKIKRFEVRLKLMEECARIFKKEIDLLVLNDISSLFFKYAIFNEGKIIYQCDDSNRADFESGIIGEYFDFQPFLNLYNNHYVKINL